MSIYPLFIHLLVVIWLRLIPAYAMVVQPVPASIHLKKFRSQLDSNSWTFGIFATEKIPAHTIIYELMGLMAQNPYEHHSDLSEIYAHPDQKKGQGPRVLFGPIRFINHECRKSNAEVCILLDYCMHLFNSQCSFLLYGTPMLLSF